MTGVLVVLAVFSAIGGFVALPHFLRAAAAAARAAGSAAALETPLLVDLDRDRARGSRRRRAVLRSATRRARPRVAPAASPRCTRCSAGKYFIDELYDRLLGRPLVLDLGSRLPALRRPRAARRHARTVSRVSRSARAGALGRVQTGNLHLYALFVLSAGSSSRCCGASAMADARAAQRRPLPAGAGHRAARCSSRRPRKARSAGSRSG